MPRRQAEDIGRSAGHARERGRQVDHTLVDQAQGQAEQGLEAGDAGLGLGERALLGVRLVRLVVGADCRDAAVGDRAAQCIAVAQGAERRRDMALGVESLDVHLGQVQLVRGDVGGDLQPDRLGLAEHAYCGHRRQRAEVHLGIAGLCKGQVARDGDALGRRRDAGQAQPGRDRPLVCAATGTQVAVLGAQEHRKTEGRGVLERTALYQRRAERITDIADRDAAGVLQGPHLGEVFAVQPAGQRAGGQHTGLAELARHAVDQFDHRGVVDHRTGVRCAQHRGDAAGRRRGRLAGQRRLVLVARFAQVRGQVDQAGADDAAARVDHLVGGELGRCITDRDHGLAVDVQVEAVVDAVRRVDQAAVDDADAHASSPASVLRSDCDCIAIDITAMRTAMP